MSADITDTILSIVQNDEYSPEQDHILPGQILALYDKFELTNLGGIKPLNVVYMFYGALLSLSYTTKLQNHGIEALLVRKSSTSLKILISYKTENLNDLKIKVLALDFEHRTGKLTPFSAMLANDMYQKLHSIRGDSLSPETFREKFRNYQLYAVYQNADGRIDIDLINMVVNLAENFHEKRKLTRGFQCIIPDAAKFSTLEFHLINLRRTSIDEAKTGAKKVFGILTDIYQTMADQAQLSKLESNFYSFIVGALELNFAKEYKLTLTPRRHPLNQEFVEIGVRIQTEYKQWLSTTFPIIFKAVRANDESWEKYSTNEDAALSALLDETVEQIFKLVDTEAEKVILLNVNYDRVLSNILVLGNGVHECNLVKSTMIVKELPIIIPHEQFIGLLLEPMTFENYEAAVHTYTKQIWQAIGSFYDKIPINLPIYHNTFESYVFGLLLSGNSLEIDDEQVEAHQFHYREPLFSKFVVTVALFANGRPTAVLLNMIQVKDDLNFNALKDYLHSHNVELPQNIQQVVRITIGANDRNGGLFIDPVSSNHMPTYLEGELKAIDRLNADDTLTSMALSKESKYTLINNEHNLHKVLENFKVFLNRRHMSNDDIRAFLRGFFAEGFVIDYEDVPDLVGVMNADGTPLFIAVETVDDGGNYPSVARNKLNSIMKNYIKDYISNPMRRTADFVCLVHNMGAEAEYKGLMRMSTYGPSGSIISQCASTVGRTRLRRHINALCKDIFGDEETSKKVKGHHDRDFYLTDKIESNDVSNEIIAIKKVIETKLAVPVKIETYLPKLAKFSGALMTGVIFKDMLGALIRQDYKDFAINAAFLAGGPLIESLSVRASAFASKLVMAGRPFVGKTLLVTMPFLSRLPIQGFIAYDLVQQVKRYKAGDVDAKVNIIGDSTILATELVTASIDGAAALGYLTAAAEFTGPMGMAIGTAIFIGVDIYTAVRTVAKIESLVHLTGWERFTSGLLSFIHVSPTSKVQNLMLEKRIADASAENAMIFFQEHPYIKNYIFPKYRFEGGKLKFMNNNYADLKMKMDKWNRVWPKNVNQLKLTCSPYSFRVRSSNNKLKTRKILHECQDMFGYENLNNTHDATTVILLEGGNDTIECAPNQNTIVMGDGFKTIKGNSNTDTFILKGSSTQGVLNGMGGDDLLNLNSYAIDHYLEIDLTEKGFIKNLKNGRKITLNQVHNLVGRDSAFETVFCDCNSKFLDTRGGSMLKADEIIINSNLSCNFNMQVNIQGHMNISNLAQNGSFNYVVENKNLSVNIKFEDNSQANHFFTIVNSSLDQIELFKVSRNKNHTLEYDIEVNFRDYGKLTLINSNEITIFHIGSKTEIRTVKDTIQIFVWSDSNDTYKEIQEYYGIARKLGAVIHIQARTRNSSILIGCGKASYYDSDSAEEINHINMIPSDPNRYSYLVGCQDNQNVYRISVPDLHDLAKHGGNSTYLEPMLPVELFNINFELQNVSNVLDLYELVLLMRLQNYTLNYNLSVIDKNCIKMEIFYKHISMLKYSSLINITMNDVDFYHLIVINLRRPMRISYTKNAKVQLMPTPINKYNSSYFSINTLEIEPYTEILSYKSLEDGFDTFIMQNHSLLITNAQYVEKEEDSLVVYLNDFFIELEMQTLSLVFSDQIIRLEEKVDEWSESEVLEDVIDDNDFSAFFPNDTLSQ